MKSLWHKRGEGGIMDFIQNLKEMIDSLSDQLDLLEDWIWEIEDKVNLALDDSLSPEQKKSALDLLQKWKSDELKLKKKLERVE
jgi:hypothetical protein